MKFFCRALAWMVVAIWPWVTAAQTATVAIQANQPSANISSNLFGIFFEEINMAGDGGIYAELIRNRMFADSSTSIPWWTFVTNGTAAGGMSLDSSVPLSATNPACLKLTMDSGSGTVGVVNNGYYGIPLTSGATYNLGFYARAANGFSSSINVLLESSNGLAVYAHGSVNGLTTNWQHFTLSLVPNTTDPGAQLALQISQTGSVYMDVVSLFPAQTFDNRTNGLRPDLAEMLVNLQPSFMRFPGGSWVGGSSLADAYHWKLTVGPLQDRTERANIWGYEVSNGLGYEEYLQMCEDVGALPLLCINCGMDDSGSQDAVPPGQLGPWIQEALDAIEYANGSTNTYWGAQRAANGHPMPFNLQYIEIGNENSGSAYNTNYALFYNAIKASYPDINIIANNQGSIPTDAPVDVMDEHFYNSASWFAQNSTMFDSYSRSGPKVFIGEYAVAYAIPPNTYPATLGNALGEAAWMTGLERNADLVLMASYAPLFCNWNNANWYPNLIYFNGTSVYGTPSYYVQQMFSSNRGNVVLPTSVSVSGNPLYVSSSLIQSNNQIIIKAVNVNNSAMTTTFNLNGVGTVAPTATIIQLAGNPGATNSFAAPTAIYPVTNIINNAGTSFTTTLPANSLTVFRLEASDFQAITNLQIQFNSPLNVGQEAVSVVSGEVAGQPVSLAGNHALDYYSLNTNIAMVNADGLVMGTGAGTTAIVATYPGLMATQMVQVLAAPATRLIHRYSFNDGTANDSVGTANGTFYNSSGQASISGGQLNLAGNSGDYVDLGPGLITTTNILTGAVTIEAWATFNPVNGAWARLFDFGNISGSSGGNYIFLAANNSANGGTACVAVTDSVGNGDETGFNLANLLGPTEMQVAVVFNPTPGRQFLGLYTNGVLAGTISTGGKYIASINDVYSFLGHSLWISDAWLNGSIDEFRIYDGELGKFQIAADYQAGPNQTNDSVGGITGLILQPGSISLPQGDTSQVAAQLKFTNAGSVSVLDDPDLMLTSDNTNVFTVNASGLLTAIGYGKANLIAVYDYTDGNTITAYTNSVAITVLLPASATLEHRYSFSDTNGSTTVADSVGGAGWNGTVMAGGIDGGPTGGAFTNGQLTLSAASQEYVQLPAGIISNYSAVTIEAWLTFPDQLPVNCFFYGFGNTDSGGQGTDYIFCAPQGGRIAITSTNYSGEENAAGTGDLSYHTNLHLVAVYDPPAGYLAFYTNGVLAAMNNSVTVPMGSVSDVLSYIGRSLYSSDPYPDMVLDEFRIYNGALNTNEIAATQLLGVAEPLSTASPKINFSQTGAQVTLSWPLNAAGFTVMCCTNLASGIWVPFNTAQIIGNDWQLTVPMLDHAEFFRLEE